MHVDVCFALNSRTSIAADHGYALYGAVSRLLPHVHAENGVGIHPIRGRQVGNRQLMLMPWSKLILRVADDQIASMLPLAGKSLRLSGSNVQVGVPAVHALIPASTLRSRLVIIKVAHILPESVTAEQFAEAVRRQLDDLKVSERPIVSIGKRRTLRVKRREIVGYELIVERLTAEESITLQEKGLGGKRHMGCGLFQSIAQSGRSNS